MKLFRYIMYINTLNIEVCMYHNIYSQVHLKPEGVLPTKD